MESIKNRKAKYNFTTEETVEGGIVLQGWEVKPILSRKINLENSHIIIKDGELFLLNAVIDASDVKDKTTIEPSRSRKLLLHKKEIMRLVGKVQQDGFTLIPTKIYQKGKHIKVEISLAKGKKLHDKREAKKEEDVKRDLARIMKKKM